MADGKGRSLDRAALAAIKAARALSDPIIVAPRAASAAACNPRERLQDHITAARFQQALATPVDDPIRRATWPETALYLSTVSLVRPLDADGTALYRWAFRRYLVDVAGVAPEDLPAPADVDPPAAHLRRRLETLRKRIKVSRDEIYLETEYDPDCGVPKAFWTDWHSGPASGYDEADYQRRDARDCREGDDR